MLVSWAYGVIILLPLGLLLLLLLLPLLSVLGPLGMEWR